MAARPGDPRAVWLPPGLLNATHIVNQPAGPGLSALHTRPCAWIRPPRAQGTTVRNFLDKILVESRIQSLAVQPQTEQTPRNQRTKRALATRENFLAHS